MKVHKKTMEGFDGAFMVLSNKANDVQTMRCGAVRILFFGYHHGAAAVRVSLNPAYGATGRCASTINTYQYLVICISR